MLVDANLLLYAVDETSPHAGPAAEWLTGVLGGSRRVALPWQTIGAFLRISTHPRIMTEPLTAERAWAFVHRWLEAEPTWIPPTGERTARVLGTLLTDHQVTANLVPDAMLAALAIEHGLTVVSADSDFARFPEVAWTNPLVAR
ncbi:MAG: TA system VapC family ribonuclease toxin [Acidimicrobiales bacterium]